MFRNRAALQLGLQLIQHKLGKAAGDPSFSATGAPGSDSDSELPVELPTTAMQTRDRSAKIKPPRIITPR